jgi:hypothetical protein
MDLKGGFNYASTICDVVLLIFYCLKSSNIRLLVLRMFPIPVCINQDFNNASNNDFFTNEIINKA